MFLENYFCLGPENSICWNIRNFSEWFFFWAQKVPSWNFLNLDPESSISWNIRKTFYWENIGKFHFPNYKSFFRKSTRNFFRVDLFYFLSLCWKVRQVDPYSTTINFMAKSLCRCYTRFYFRTTSILII